MINIFVVVNIILCRCFIFIKKLIDIMRYYREKLMTTKMLISTKKKKKALIVHVTHREHIIFFKTNRLDFEDSGESTVCC